MPRNDIQLILARYRFGRVLLHLATFLRSRRNSAWHLRCIIRETEFLRPLAGQILRLICYSPTVFRVRGVPVRITTACLLYPAGVLGWLGWREGGLSGVLAMCVFLLMVYGSILMHEFAHVAAARVFGSRTESVVLTPLGGIALIEQLAAPTSEMIMAAAGPAMSLMLAQALSPHFVRHYLGLHVPFDLMLLLKGASELNWMIGLFNLLPCFPSDGGRILRGIIFLIIRLCHPRLNQSDTVATRVALRWVGWPLFIGMFFWGIVSGGKWGIIATLAVFVALGEWAYAELKNEHDAGAAQ